MEVIANGLLLHCWKTTLTKSTEVFMVNGGARMLVSHRLWRWRRFSLRRDLSSTSMHPHRASGTIQVMCPWTYPRIGQMPASISVAAPIRCLRLRLTWRCLVIPWHHLHRVPRLGPYLYSLFGQAQQQMLLPLWRLLCCSMYMSMYISYVHVCMYNRSHGNAW